MNGILDFVLEKIEAANRFHGQKLRKRISTMDLAYFKRAEMYYAGYDAALCLEGKSIQFAIECYLKMCDDMFNERLAFLRTGKYANSSYQEVERTIYNNPAVMEYHIHGLGLAQFLWIDQYERFRFFSEGISAYVDQIRSYLEIGGGHGLYAKEALAALKADARLDVLDISASSLTLAQQMVGPSRINYILKDVFLYETEHNYDFITIAEVIEHVENPAELLARVRYLLTPDGVVYLTTPVNAPMIDHIYLFSHMQEIRDLLVATGFQIISEKHVISEDLPEEKAVAQKVPIMYAAFLQKSRS